MDHLPNPDVRPLLIGLLEGHLLFRDSFFAVPFLVFQLFFQSLCTFVRIVPTPLCRLRHRLRPPPIFRCEWPASFVIDPRGILKKPDYVPTNRILYIKGPPISLDVVVMLA